MDHLINQIFKKSTLGEVQMNNIEEFIIKYPYFSLGHIWLTKLRKNFSDVEFNLQLECTNLYLGDLFLFQHFLLEFSTEDYLSHNNFKDPYSLGNFNDVTLISNPELPSIPKDIEINTSIPERETDISIELKKTKGNQDKPISIQNKPNNRPHSLGQNSNEETFQPLYTVDYFAFKGESLPDILDPSKKPTLEQLRSFTDWLRSTKRLKKVNSEIINSIIEKNSNFDQLYDDKFLNSKLGKIPDNSISNNNNIATETMAEVWIKQGQMKKAIDIFEKLSVLYPEKMDYFASKISELDKKI